ncbi:unnamed protein product [Closterium sp. NIES-54]
MKGRVQVVCSGGPQCRDDHTVWRSNKPGVRRSKWRTETEARLQEEANAGPVIFEETEGGFEEVGERIAYTGRVQPMTELLRRVTLVAQSVARMSADQNVLLTQCFNEILWVGQEFAERDARYVANIAKLTSEYARLKESVLLEQAKLGQLRTALLTAAAGARAAAADAGRAAATAVVGELEDKFAGFIDMIGEKLKATAAEKRPTERAVGNTRVEAERGPVAEEEKRVREEQAKVAERAERAAVEQRKKAKEEKRVREEQAKAAEWAERAAVEQRKKAEEEKRVREEQAKATERAERAAVEQRKKAEEKKRVREEQAKAAERAERAAVEKRNKAEEEKRVREEQAKAAERAERAAVEQRKKAEEEKSVQEEQAKAAKQRRAQKRVELKRLEVEREQVAKAAEEKRVQVLKRKRDL